MKTQKHDNDVYINKRPGRVELLNIFERAFKIEW